MEIELRSLKGNVIHDFPYPRCRRKCPHVALISITHSGSCIHKCPMCYARAYPWSVEDKIIVYKNVPEKLEAEINKARVLPPFYISQVSDALQNVPEVRAITFKVIQILMRYKLSFRIITKSADGALSLLDALSRLGGIKYPYWGLSMTVEATPEKQEITSPYADKIEARLSAIKKFTELGIPVIGRTDPTILGFIKIEDVQWIIKKLAMAGVHHIIGSLGYYNYISATRLLSAIENSKWRDCIPEVERIYGFPVFARLKPCPTRKRFMASMHTRIKFHSILRDEAKKYGLTYAVCLELPKEYDSPGISSCEPGQRNFVHKRIEGFPSVFQPVKCSGSCLQSCPDKSKPPCGKIELLTQYPYVLKTLQ